VLKSFAAYSRNGANPLVSFLKSTLVPQKVLNHILPESGFVCDVGCGEGVFSNIVALMRKNVSVMGFDISAKQILQANRCRRSNSIFLVADSKAIPVPKADCFILNDFLHHLSLDEQEKLLFKLFDLLNPGGIIIIKEVDQNDPLDRFHTTFWDTKIYPNDLLHFRTQENWCALIEAVGFRKPKVFRQYHPWPASRTIFACEKNSS
jgi:2-polyprenyl-3-methyl-5-hydroxy-6-metoxy-1,4-benzoquinol methylase